MGVNPEYLGYGSKIGSKIECVSIDETNYISVHWGEDGESTCSVVTMRDGFSEYMPSDIILCIEPHYIDGSRWSVGTLTPHSLLSNNTGQAPSALREIVIRIPEDIFYEWFATKTQYL